VGYAVSYFDSSSLEVQWTATDGGLVRPNVSYGGEAPPVGQLAWDTAAQHFIYTATPSTSSLGIFLLGVSSNTPLTGVAKVAGSNASASLGDKVVFLAMADAAGCYVFSCPYGGTSASCGSAPFTLQSCTAIRTVASGTHYFGAALMNPQTITAINDDAVGWSYTASSVDTPQAFVATTASGTSSRVVWRSNGTLMTTTFPKPPNASPVTANSMGFTGPGPGFDAVGDGPSLPGYAVVYFQNDANAPAIELVHRCQ
jgi:hypothetical protein